MVPGVFDLSRFLGGTMGKLPGCGVEGASAVAVGGAGRNGFANSVGAREVGGTCPWCGQARKRCRGVGGACPNGTAASGGPTAAGIGGKVCRSNEGAGPAGNLLVVSGASSACGCGGTTPPGHGTGGP